MKKIIVTPAGRKKFLEILYNSLYDLRDQFDEWVLWANTNNQEDLDYIYHLSNSNDFISHIDLDVPFDGNFSISSFFKYSVDEDSMYLRLDDDICFIEKDAIKNIFEYREQNTDPFLVYGNIVNNTIINSIQQKSGRYPSDVGHNKYYALEYIEEDTCEIAASIHSFFIDKYLNNSLDDLKFSKWKLLDYERVSINSVCWFGKDFKIFNGIPDFSKQSDNDEEEFLSCTMPKELGRPNEICGNAIFVHFSYNKQLSYILENYPTIYNFYSKI